MRIPQNIESISTLKTKKNLGGRQIHWFYLPNLGRISKPALGIRTKNDTYLTPSPVLDLGKGLGFFAFRKEGLGIPFFSPPPWDGLLLFLTFSFLPAAKPQAIGCRRLALLFLFRRLSHWFILASSQPCILGQWVAPRYFWET